MELTLDLLTSLDTALFLWINAGPQPLTVLLQFAEFMSESTPALAGIGLLVTAVAGGRALRRAVLCTLLAMSLSWIAVSLIRRGFPLPRPAALQLGWQWMAHSGSAGFPSHHAAGAFACWAALALSPALSRRRLLVASGLAVAASIAWSRLYLGVHFPKDVLVGGSIGCLSALLVSLAARRVGALLQRRRAARRSVADAGLAPGLRS